MAEERECGDMVDRSSADQIRVPANFFIASIALIFFGGSLAFWTYSWWNSDRPESLDALRYAGIFFGGGLATLLLWRVTSG